MGENQGIGKPGDFRIFGREGQARVGEFATAHGVFDTPAFMPVGTQGTVKGVSPLELRELGAQVILANTYHLHLRPGDLLIRDLGGLHRFCGWDGPILTDSGGYQVFSLAHLREVNDDHVTFQSHIDGKSVSFTPEKVVEIQENLGVDIMMVLDECLPYPVERAEAERSWKRTLSWAQRSQQARKRRGEVLAFGIVQGAMDRELRERAALELAELDFDGYAIGGLSVGEPNELMLEMCELSAAKLPQDRVRYLMGVGTPVDILEAVGRGIDLFDCVIPTRSARFGRLYTGPGYINIRNSCFRRDERPIEPGCDCYTCRHFSRAYVAHLIHSNEMFGSRLATLHNLRFYQRHLSNIRDAISEQRFEQFRVEFLQQGESSDG